jgi:hypothetical protein
MEAARRTFGQLLAPAVVALLADLWASSPSS